ncbi:hypothetical protein ACFY8W_23570 [Streptomyces sp. NPDC012637]|uniref:hypothetical protein n=1 Tax=Streptomyces sp. NPDC012637 TaxID=3364842 RepID=UPI0036E86843
MTATASLARRAAVEFVGTGALAAVVVGSGIQATTLLWRDVVLLERRSPAVS